MSSYSLKWILVLAQLHCTVPKPSFFNATKWHVRSMCYYQQEKPLYFLNYFIPFPGQMEVAMKRTGILVMWSLTRLLRVITWTFSLKLEVCILLTSYHTFLLVLVLRILCASRRFLNLMIWLTLITYTLYLHKIQWYW